MTCIICWEEDLVTEQQQVLRPCQHMACKACINDWIETCESQGHDEAKCPHCRQVISAETCQAVLCRLYKPKTKTAEDVPEELDDFTMTWLQENGARQCPHCGAWIINEEGNEPIMCLCGYCYCWNCDDCALDCDCCHNEIYDNVTGQDITIDRDELRVATEADKRNFRAFLERRRNGEDVLDSDESTSVLEEPAEADLTSIFDCQEEIVVGSRPTGQAKSSMVPLRGQGGQ